MKKNKQRKETPDVRISGTSHEATTPGAPGVNPFNNDEAAGSGEVNPSGPTTGTESWGLHPDEEPRTRRHDPDNKDKENEEEEDVA